MSTEMVIAFVSLFACGTSVQNVRKQQALFLSTLSFGGGSVYVGTGMRMWVFFRTVNVPTTVGILFTGVQNVNSMSSYPLYCIRDEYIKRRRIGLTAENLGGFMQCFYRTIIVTMGALQY